MQTPVSRPVNDGKAQSSILASARAQAEVQIANVYAAGDGVMVAMAILHSFVLNFPKEGLHK